MKYSLISQVKRRQLLVAIYKITGLGICILAEFGHFLLYNILVDAGDEGLDDLEDDTMTPTMRGYKQMLLVLQSPGVDTGKSFLSETLVRIFHGRKQGIFSTVSFDGIKPVLGRGEPVVIGVCDLFLLSFFNSINFKMIIITTPSGLFS